MMKACIGEEGCGATGNIFGGVKPLSWAWCIRCKGTGFVEGSPIGSGTIIMPALGTTVGGQEQVFSLSDFAKIKNPLMAHVMAKAGIFPSVGQARKNGWDKPLTSGKWSVTKKKIRIRVEK